MVEMQVRDHDVLNFIHVNAQRRQALKRRSEQTTPAAFRYLGAEAGVDDTSTVSADRHPNVVIHVDAAIVRIAPNEQIATLPGIEIAILYRMQPIHERLPARLGPDDGVAPSRDTGQFAPVTAGQSGSQEMPTNTFPPFRSVTSFCRAVAGFLSVLDQSQPRVR